MSTSETAARSEENYAGVILGVTTVFHVLALVVVGLRSYTRIFLVRLFGVQDAFMVLSCLCAFLGGTLTLFMQLPYGLGRHSDTISAPDKVAFNQLSFVQSVVPLMGGIAFLKIAIALELMKLKGIALAWYHTILWCLIAFVTIYTFIAWFSFFLFCRPLARYWDKSIDGTCYSVSLFVKFGLVNTGFNIFTDIAFATLPVPIIWALKMPLKTRLYLVGVLSLGYVAVIMGILKAIAQIHYSPMDDNTYKYEIQFYGILQLNLGIVAACAPSLKPLVRNLLSLKSLTPGYGYTNSNGYNNQRSGRNTGLYTRQTSRTDREDFELRSAHRPNAQDIDLYTATVEGRDVSTSPGLYPIDGKDRDSTSRNDSQETILSAERGKNGIVRTTEVTVTY